MVAWRGRWRGLLLRAWKLCFERLRSRATLLVAAPADAIVGGGTPSAEGVGRAIVTIVGSRGNFCTGALIAPKLVLTAAHCVQPGAEYKIVEYGPDRQPLLQDVKAIAVHPGFNAQAMLAHRATADVALLQLETPAKGKTPRGARHACHSDQCRQPLHHCRHRRNRARRWQERRHYPRCRPGSQPANRGHCKFGWSIRSGRGPVTDSVPAPVIPAPPLFEDKPGGPVIVGVVSWSTGPNGAAGCGGLTGVTPLTLYRDWILQTARQWGSAL